MKYVPLIIIILLVLLTFPGESFAQGPPIITDTPILLGLEGKAVAVRTVVVKKSRLYQDGNRISDPLQREVTATIFPISVPYNVTSDLLFGMTIPLTNIHITSLSGDNTSFGLSDISLFAKYLVVQVDELQETFRVIIKGSVKLPTGNKNRTPALGTGTFDYSFGTVGAWIGKRFGIYGDVSYILNGTSDGYKFGNSFSYNAAIAFRAIPAVYKAYPTDQWNLYLELNGKSFLMDDENGQALQNTGRNIVFLSPGIQYILSRIFLVEGSLQIPIIQSLNGTQLGTDFSANVGIRLLLF